MNIELRICCANIGKLKHSTDKSNCNYEREVKCLCAYCVFEFYVNWKEKQRWGFCVTTAHLQCYQIHIWRSATNEYNFVLAEYVDVSFCLLYKRLFSSCAREWSAFNAVCLCELSFANEHVDKYLSRKGQKRKYPTSKHTEITPLTIARCFNPANGNGISF